MRYTMCSRAAVSALTYAAKGCDTIVNGIAEKGQAYTSEDTTKYMFESGVDATLYLVVYFVLPLYSVVTGMSRADCNLFLQRFQPVSAWFTIVIPAIRAKIIPGIRSCI